ncbi:MAG: DUF5009 domain-containing protein, partial [Gemmatimonadetes bacterium]|nr:DUF5009 domain-containing protein [Gemmatimonadota bacterium]
MDSDSTGGALPVGRLMSLDAFRGLTIAGMILVNNPGSWAHVYPPLAHAEWHGWTPTDLIFPFFLFIVGVALPFSFAKRLARGDSRRDLFLHVLRRSAILLALGLFLGGFPRFDLSTIRIMGVLQRIGVVYLFAASAYLFLKVRGRWVLTATLLLGYWALMTLVPIPGYGAGVLTQDGNLAAYVDRLFLDGHMWRETWDPEGLLSTLPAIGTTLLGIFAGEWLRSERAGGRKTSGLLMAGVVGVAAGLAWDVVFPINKGIWTSSYVVFTAGAALLLLGLLYWMIDVRLWRSWSKPMVVYGMNAIAVFVASGLVARIMGLWRVGGGEGVPLKTWVYEHVF